MKKLTKKMKSIIIAGVSLVCVAAIVLGCVFGLRKPADDGSKGGKEPAYKLSAQQIELGDAVNASAREHESFAKFSAVELSGGSKVSSLSSFGKMSEIGMQANNTFYVSTLGGYVSLSEKLGKEVKFAAENGNYVSYTYQTTEGEGADAKNYVNYAVAHVDAKGNVKEVFASKVEMLSASEFVADGGSCSSYALVLCDDFFYTKSIVSNGNYFRKLNFYGYSTKTISEPLNTISFTQGSLDSITNLDAKVVNSTVLTYTSLVNNKFVVVYSNGNEVKTATFDWLGSETTYEVKVVEGGAVVVKTQNMLDEPTKNSVLVGSDYFEYEYFTINFATGEIKELALEDGYAKYEIKTIADSKYFVAL